MTRQKLFLFVGVLLTLLSVQNNMFKELVYNWEMNRKYKITELNEMYKGIPTRYQFGSKIIETNHILKDESPFRDPWDKIINLADIYITIDGEEKEVLRNFPVSIGEDGLNQYSNYVSYWFIFDKKTKEESYAVVLQTTREILRTLDGYIPREEQEYRIITISKDGKVKTEDFSYKTKSKLQTKLIPPMDEGPAGYYTDDWSGYPTFLVFIYPFLYPIITLIIGIILTFTSLFLMTIKKFKGKEKSS